MCPVLSHTYSLSHVSFGLGTLWTRCPLSAYYAVMKYLCWCNVTAFCFPLYYNKLKPCNITNTWLFLCLLNGGGSPCVRTPPSSPWHGGPAAVRLTPLPLHPHPRPLQKALVLPLKWPKENTETTETNQPFIDCKLSEPVLPLDGCLYMLPAGPLPPLTVDPTPSTPHLGRCSPQRSRSLHHLQTPFGLT